MHTRYLSRKFFMDHCHDIIEIIAYYGFGNLVYYTQPINLDHCAEFITTYTIRAGGQDIILSLDLLMDHLEISPLTSTFFHFTL